MLRAFAIVLLLSVPASAQSDAWYRKAVKSVDATIDPAEARPGQTVTFRITIELNDGYHTYPTAQPDKKADAFVNKITFPEAGTLIFVGSVKDPEKPDVKAEPALGIKELRTYHGTVVFERTAVVSPKAAVGDAAIALKAFHLNVCDADTCFPAKSLTPAAKLTVKGAAMQVEKAWADEVEKALTGK